MRIVISALAALAATTAAAHAVPMLRGYAVLPADSFVPGSPASGNFASDPKRATPFANNPVQGVSGIIRNADGSYKVLQDNGYGAKGNSADAILYSHDVAVDWRTPTGGTGLVTVLGSNPFTDKNSRSGFTIVADQAKYPLYNPATGSSTPSTIDVAAAIRDGRLLTGADYDPESFRRVKDGSYYVGDEFGPFLLHFDRNFNLIEAPIALPGVFAPENPFRGATPNNLGGSRGFEGMALSADGLSLFTLLEGTVTGDPARTLRINQYDLATRQYTASQWLYPLSAGGTAIGDMTAIGDNRFIVIERDGGQGATAAFKRLFLVTLDAGGVVTKTEIADLLNIADPADLNGDGAAVYTMPFVTIEDVLPVDAYTLLIGNDNNYPFSAGRTAGVPDNNEFALIRFDRPLFADVVPAPAALALFGLGALGLMLRRR